MGAAPFREAKLMLLGEGGAGKTNFSNYIMDLPFEKGKSATTGIKIDHWKPNINGNEYRFNIWDFGGQWIQQQVHQFFLTSECVYVIILNARNLEKPHKWLDWIKNYGANSKTIIVANQMEENANKYIEENNLKAEYPFIHSFHYISLLNAHNRDEREVSNINYLLEKIKEQLILLKNIHVLHPINYHKLKSDLEDNFFNKSHSLAFETFEQKLIQEHNIKGNSEILLKVLQTMGTVRYFQNYDRLILSPEWLSDGVYKIMMSNFANEKFGVLNESDIVSIVKENCNSHFTYKDSDINFLRQLMQDFELAYIDENKNYFIPTQFKTDIPNDFYINEQTKSSSLEFIFEFDTYFPEILISKLIVHFFSRVKNGIYWKTGVLLEDKDAELQTSVSALVQSIEKERRIKIYMFGNDIRGFFKEIRNKILDYLKNTNYKYAENVINKEYRIELEYNELITFYQNNVNEVIKSFQGKVLKINVKETLGLINNNVELEALKKENEELRKKEKKMSGNAYTFNIDKVENLQAGDYGKMIFNKNTFNQIIDKKEEIQSIIQEIDKIKENNNIQENINDIFIELLNELSKLNINDLESEPEKSNTILQKVYDNGKKLNDWKNITILPYEIIDKGTKIIEGLKPFAKSLMDNINLGS
ncbi:COR domain-containing protein [Flavobacterium sp.]|jgi:internalin A|uniref:COR domain-containing protein n=1 Tax=Flavobacterium sp. TaxID=239 RepID=UPI0037BE4E13